MKELAMVKMILLVMGSLILAACGPDGDFSDQVPQETPLGKVDTEQGNVEPTCSEIKQKLGQVLYVNVDGFGNNVSEAIHPAYIQMVKDLNIGGVIPHFGKRDYLLQKKSVRALQDAAELPLFIGVDYDDLDVPSTMKQFGLGYWGGFMTYNLKRNKRPDCLRQSAYFEAFLHRAIGLNLSLGPTIEYNSRWGLTDKEKIYDIANEIVDAFDIFGVATTMKHFPYTPDSFDLHDRTEDTRLPESDVLKMLEHFSMMQGKMDFAMTTHLYNSNIDPDDLATFSPRWMSLLRDVVGFDGLVMTDGLFMMNNYKESMRKMSSRWEGETEITHLRDHTIFAVRALLAGHDLIFLEGMAQNTRDLFDNIATIACEDQKVGPQLRRQIAKAYDRIVSYKQKHEAALRQHVEYPSELMSKVVNYYNTIDRDNICNDAEFAQLRKEIEKVVVQPLP